MKYAVWFLIPGLMIPCLATAGETVSISRRDCSRLVQYVPSDDVAYKPGVDMHGNPVVPADLEGSGNSIKLLPEVLQFNVNINPLVGQSTQAQLAAKGLDNTSMNVAQIHYDIGKNQFFINGQPLGPPELRALAEACAKAGVK